QLASTVAAGKPDLRKAVVAHLTETGSLTERKAFLATRHVTRGTERTELLAPLTAVVLDEAEPSEEDVLLLGVLQHLNLARR
ncbi:GPP34 family phosphoprotein, partial [Micrococcus sp. SIMBA_144]